MAIDSNACTLKHLEPIAEEIACRSHTHFCEETVPKGQRLLSIS